MDSPDWDQEPRNAAEVIARAFWVRCDPDILTWEWCLETGAAVASECNSLFARERD